MALASSTVRARPTQTPTIPAATVPEQTDSTEATERGSPGLNPAVETLWSQWAKVLTAGTSFGLTTVFLLASVLSLAYLVGKVHSLATNALHTLRFYEKD